MSVQPPADDPEGSPRRAREDLSVEAGGETVGEAKWAALRELERLQPGLDKASVQFQVVSEGARGLLGVGYEPARVVATVAAAPGPEPGDATPRAGESPEATLLRELVDRITRALGVRCSITVHETEAELVADCNGRDLGMLIGRRGQTIDAVQYLAGAIVYRDREDRKRVIVDAAGYRARRQASLDALAVRAAERASATGQRVELEPMSAVERKIVHEALKDDPEVETVSEGIEPHRFVVVVPRNVAV